MVANSFRYCSNLNLEMFKFGTNTCNFASSVCCAPHLQVRFCCSRAALASSLPFLLFARCACKFVPFCFCCSRIAFASSLLFVAFALTRCTCKFASCLCICLFVLVLCYVAFVSRVVHLRCTCGAPAGAPHILATNPSVWCTCGAPVVHRGCTTRRRPLPTAV